MADQNKQELVYHGTKLEPYDIETLRPGRELSDAVISFWMKYMRNEIFPDISDKLLFVDTNVSQLIKLIPNMAANCLLSLNADKKDLVFFPVNDSIEREAYESGGHWSLLVYSRNDDEFISFDSLNDRNHKATTALFNSVKDVFGSKATEPKKARCLQQRDGFNCGIFVICHAEQLGRYFEALNTITDLPMMDYETTVEKREELQAIIQSLMIVETKPPSKKSRLFLRLGDIHPKSTSDSLPVSSSTPWEDLQRAAQDLRRTIDQTPRKDSDPKKFAVATDLIMKSVVIKINNKMLPAAINFGNIVTEKMLKPKLNVSGETEHFVITCPFGCQSQLIVPPLAPTCRMVNIFNHFDSENCGGRDYGWPRATDPLKKMNRNEKRRKPKQDGDIIEIDDEIDGDVEEIITLSLKVPAGAEEALKFIVSQKSDVIIKLAEDLKKQQKPT